MKLTRGKIIALAIIIFVVTIISSLYIAYNTSHNGYKNLYLLPLVYGICFVFFFSPLLNRLKNIYMLVFIAVSFTRYVVLPCLITMTKFYGGRSSSPPLDSSFNEAIILMVYELIVVSGFTYFLFRKSDLHKTNPLRDMKMPKSTFLYGIFIISSLLLGGIFPISFKNFSFLVINDNLLNWSQSSFAVNLTVYLLVISKFLLFIIVLSWLFKRYKKYGNNIYIFLSFLVVLLNMSIIFGQNRADFIITSIASILLFFKLFPKHIIKTLIPLGIVLFLITSAINEHRDNQSITNGENELVDFTETLQAYLAGPYNVAISIESAQLNPAHRKPLNLVYEIARPVIGLNVVLKNFEITSSSQYFNERIYFRNHQSQILPMIGQGYFYLGFLLSPIITIFYLLLAKYLIIMREKVNRIEMFFFLSIPIARIGFATAQNGSILANDISFFLVLFIIIYLLNKKFVLRKENLKYSNSTQYSIKE